jgi:hypothetical protein
MVYLPLIGVDDLIPRVRTTEDTAVRGDTCRMDRLACNPTRRDMAGKGQTGWPNPKVANNLFVLDLHARNMSEAPEIFDSLPYYDDDLEKFPILKQKVEQELAREPKPPQTLHPRVPPPVTLFAVRAQNKVCMMDPTLISCTQNNPMLEAELARVESHHTLPPLDTIRYQLPAPTSTPGTDEEWQAALKNAHAQLEHQRIRYASILYLYCKRPHSYSH